MTADRVLLAPDALREWAATMRRRSSEVEEAVRDVLMASRAMVTADTTMSIDPVYVPATLLEVVLLVGALADDTEQVAGDVVSTDRRFGQGHGGPSSGGGRVFDGWAQLVTPIGWHAVTERGNQLEAAAIVDAEGPARCTSGLYDRYPDEGFSGPWTWPVEAHAWVSAANDADKRYEGFRILRGGVVLADDAGEIAGPVARSAVGTRIADGVSDLSARFPQAAGFSRTGARMLGAVGLTLTVVDTASDFERGDWAGVVSNTASLGGSFLLASAAGGPVGLVFGGVLFLGSLAWENRETLSKLGRWVTGSPTSSTPTSPSPKPTRPTCHVGTPPSRSSTPRARPDERPDGGPDQPAVDRSDGPQGERPADRLDRRLADRFTILGPSGSNDVSSGLDQFGRAHTPARAGRGS